MTGEWKRRMEQATRVRWLGNRRVDVQFQQRTAKLYTCELPRSDILLGSQRGRPSFSSAVLAEAI